MLPAFEKLPFEIAGGSVPGRDHVRAGRNNQDAYEWYETDDLLVAVVCDGCGSGAKSEVGAILGAKLVVEEARMLVEAAGGPQAVSGDAVHMLLSMLQYRLLTRLPRLLVDLPAANVGARDPLINEIGEMFLFTIVGVIITGPITIVFSLGDGWHAVNGQATSIGPFPGNAPPYLAHQLLGDRRVPLTVHRVSPTSAIESVLLGTDGLDDFVGRADRPLPGKKKPLGLLSQFWTEDCYFKNPDAIRRHLALANRECSRIEDGRLVKHPGMLRDDTTLIAIRRTNQAEVGP